MEQVEQGSEYEELSLNERFELASNFLLDAPPGEINDVIRDITGFFKEEEEELFEPFIINKLKLYIQQNYLVVEVNNNDKTIVTKYNHLGEDTYYCPKLKIKFNLEPVTQKVEVIETNYLHNEENEELRTQFSLQLNIYQQQHYPNGDSMVYYQDGQFIFVIFGLKLSQKNYWNGRLKSEWKYDVSNNELKGSISGTVHYYEEGNVQLHSNKEFDVKIEVNETQKNNFEILSKMIVDKIATKEQEYQLALNEGYLNLNQNAFKGLRRNLPITRSKIDWSQIFSYKIGSEIQQ
ncbi:subunits of heterodimeric actin filament capping protein Capz [Neoconidiobolus thromboides FSU 785]|nr:subunits of heterodimeric actin filament capping protein Capz [Neoconidiobolus thromboides FSU 785]